MYLEKELQDLPVRDHCGVKHDFNRFRMIAMVAISGIRHIAAGVADSRAQHAGVAAQQVLHAPEAAAGEDDGFGLVGHGLS